MVDNAGDVVESATILNLQIVMPEAGDGDGLTNLFANLVMRVAQMTNTCPHCMAMSYVEAIGPMLVRLSQDDSLGLDADKLN